MANSNQNQIDFLLDAGLIDKADGDNGESIKNYNPTLFIGLGGTGAKALNSTKKLILDAFKGKLPPKISFLSIDADQDEIRKNTYLDISDEFLAATVSDPRSWYKNHEEFAKTFFTQETFPTNAIYGASEYRQVSRMCFFNNYDNIFKKIVQKINGINPQAREGKQVFIDVFIVASLCGGAGSGMFVDIAALLRDYQNKNNMNLTIFGTFVTGDVYLNFKDIDRLRAEPIFLANTYASLKEIQYFQDLKSKHLKVNKSTPLIISYLDINRSAKVEKKLFDVIFLVQSVNRYGKVTIQSQSQLNEFLSNGLFLMSLAPFQQGRNGEWTNPISGFQELDKHYQELPTCFSSFGYYKLRYPEKEFIGYLHNFLASQIIESTYNINNLNKTNTQKLNKLANSTVAKQGDFDNVKIFSKFLNHKSISLKNISQGFENIITNNKWDALKAEIDNFIDQFEQMLKNKGTVGIKIENEKNRIISKFNDFLLNLPNNFINNGIGLSSLEYFLSELKQDFIAEKNDAIIEKNKINYENSVKIFEQDKKESYKIIDEKPLFIKRKKLKDKINDLSNSFKNYLDDSFSRLCYDNILLFYDEAIKEIQNKKNQVTSINSNFSQILSLYIGNTKNFQNQLNRLLKKNTYSSYMDFSVIESSFINEVIEQVSHETMNNSLRLQISKEYWSFSNDDNEWLEKIQNIIENSLNPILQSYVLTLNDALNQFNITQEKIKSRINFFENNCRAQWNIDDNIRKPISKTKIGYPSNYNFTQVTANPLHSSSDRAIEILRIEYALPAKSLRGISYWRELYEKRILSHGLHLFPEANNWMDLDRLPSHDEDVLLFALGMAFGEIYELTDNESIALKKMYDNKNYKNFLSGIDI